MKLRSVLLVVVAAALPGCAERLSHIGRAPELSAIESPAEMPEARVISMPMPAPAPQDAIGGRGGSLWRSGSNSFFGDQRARRVGDILTVLIDINDRAQLRNATNRSRSGSESAGIPKFLGFETGMHKLLPDVDPAQLVELASESSASGSGTVNRNETIALKVAAVVTQVLPNGNLVVSGRQEIRVNHELRELRVAGVIRPEDIGSSNDIQYDKIAEARIAYGGRGHIADVQQPRIGQQVMDVILPW